MGYFAHASAVIDDGAIIGADTRVWHFSHVSAGARIGSGVIVGQNAFIAGSAVIGDRCKIQNNVSIYDGVVLEDDVFVGPSVVFTNVHNPRANVERKSEFRGTHVRLGASLGANCTIVCGVKVGSWAFIGAGAVITKDVPDFAIVTGVPGRVRGWMSRQGATLDLPLKGDGTATCAISGERYQLLSSRCSLVG